MLTGSRYDAAFRRLMTSEERYAQNIFRKSLREQGKSFNAVVKDLSKALRGEESEQGGVALENLTQRETYQESLIRAFDSDVIKESFNRVYSHTGITFIGFVRSNEKRSPIALQTKRADVETTIWLETMTNYAQTYSAYRVLSVNRTNREKAVSLIQSIVKQAYKEGWGTVQVAKELDKQIPNAWKDFSIWQSKRIAQTEVVTASNYGAYVGAKSMGIPFAKRWVHSRKRHPRSSHIAANGQTVLTLDTPFVVNGERMQRPGDPSASASNVVNCGCHVRYVDPRQLAES